MFGTKLSRLNEEIKLNSIVIASLWHTSFLKWHKHIKCLHVDKELYLQTAFLLCNTVQLNSPCVNTWTNTQSEEETQGITGLVKH